MKTLRLVLSCALLAVVAGCSDKPAATAQTPATHVLAETTATIDVARDVGRTLGGAAAAQRQAAEQSTQ